MFTPPKGFSAQFGPRLLKPVFPLPKGAAVKSSELILRHMGIQIRDLAFLDYYRVIANMTVTERRGSVNYGRSWLANPTILLPYQACRLKVLSHPFKRKLRNSP